MINIPKTNDLSDSDLSESDSEAAKSAKSPKSGKSKASDLSKMATSAHAKDKRGKFKRENAKFEGTGVQMEDEVST